MAVFSKDRIARLQTELEGTHPQHILECAVEHFGDKLVIVTSFQPTGIVTLHMLQAIAPQTPVITLDTGLLFPQTQALIARIENHFNLRVQHISPHLNLDEQADHYGPDLWEHNPDQCCYLRKVLPLRRALAPYQAWITGLRRDQSPTRANIPIITYDDTHDMVKCSPFATWTESMIWAYIQAYDLPYNPLHDQGYPSIGCMPCTAPATNGDKRGGRWATQGKTECGIHSELAPQDTV